MSRLRASRIDDAFDRLRREGRKGLVAYMTAGDPDLKRTEDVLLGLARGGADVIEVGVPFSDPIADGPAIQRASERALAAGAHLGTTLDLVRRTRASVTTPIVLFTYVNPVLQMGMDGFVAAAAEAGVDAVLLLDLPIEESDAAKAALDRHDVDQIFLISPTTTDERLKMASRLGRGFLYAISRLGVTGTRDTVATSAHPLVDRIHRASPLPVALGFGISTPEHVREVWAFADAAVVGSAIVQTVAAADQAGQPVGDAVAQFVGWLKGQ